LTKLQDTPIAGPFLDLTTPTVTFDSAVSPQTISGSFKAVASREIQNRGLKITYTEVARDLIDTALTISTQGTLGHGRAKELLSGIGKLPSATTAPASSTHSLNQAELQVAVS